MAEANECPWRFCCEPAPQSRMAILQWPSCHNYWQTRVHDARTTVADTSLSFLGEATFTNLGLASARTREQRRTP